MNAVALFVCASRHTLADAPKDKNNHMTIASCAREKVFSQSCFFVWVPHLLMIDNIA